MKVLLLVATLNRAGTLRMQVQSSQRRSKWYVLSVVTSREAVVKDIGIAEYNDL